MKDRLPWLTPGSNKARCRALNAKGGLRMHMVLLATLTGSLLLSAAVAQDRVPPQFRRDDKNGDGRVTREEFRGRSELFKRLDRDGDGVITEAEVGQRVRDRRQEGQGTRRRPPTESDVRYGDHERHVLDIYKAKTDGVTPVFIWIHGGGFRAGSKDRVNPAILEPLLKNGISVVSINYRLSQHAIAPACFLDGARAVQFVRSKAAEWGLDPNRVAVGGGSAGAGISEWIAFQDDMADADSDDPVSRQSTRVSCAFVMQAQTAYDPRFIREHIPGKAWTDPPLEQLFGIDSDELDALPEEKYKLFELCSPINHLTADDPPITLSYNGSADPAEAEQSIGKGIHHPIFGLKLKEKADKLGVPCTVLTEQRGIDSDALLTFLRKHLEAGAK
jgi:acetyl esterase